MVSESTYLDNIIMRFLPGWGARRATARMNVQKMQQELTLSQLKTKVTKSQVDSFSALHEDRLYGSDWMSSNLSPNDKIERDQIELVKKVETLYEKNGYAVSAVDGRVDNVVGEGYNYQSRIRALDGFISTEEASRLNEQKKKIFATWAKQEKIAEKQAQAERCVAIYGEAIVKLGFIPIVPGADRQIPLTIQVIHPRRLETPPKYASDKNVIMGIRFFPGTNTPMGYYIRTSHPDDSRGDLKYDYIDASLILHSYDAKIPGWTRGRPWMASASEPLQMVEAIMKNHLVSEQVAACFSAFVKQQKDAELDESAIQLLEKLSRSMEGGLQPGLISGLPAGLEVQFSDPTRPGSSLGDYVQIHLRKVAASLRYPYEMLLKLYDNSYAGGRLSILDGRRAFGCWQKNARVDIWDPVANAFTDYCVALGLIDLDVLKYQQDPEAFRACHWMPTKWTWIDLKNEIEAEALAVEKGLASETEFTDSRGLDHGEMLQERQRESIAKLKVEAEVEKARIAFAKDIGDPDFGKSPERIAAERTRTQNPIQEKRNQKTVTENAA